MGEKKIKSAVEINRICVKMKEGEKFSKDIFIKKCGLDIRYKEDKYQKDVERTVGELLRMLASTGFIKPSETEKSKSRGRPSIVYECPKGLNVTVDFPIDQKTTLCKCCGQPLVCKHCNQSHAGD